MNRLFTVKAQSQAEMSKRFWTHVKHKHTGTTSRVSPFKKGNQLVSLAKDKAEILNAQFTAVFFESSADIDYTELALNSRMKDIVIDRNGVHK